MILCNTLFLALGHKKNSRFSDCFLLIRALPAHAIKFQFMVQHMKSGSFLDMLLQIIQKVRVKRQHLTAFSAYEMVMVVLCLIFQQMSDLIAHASLSGPIQEHGM